MGLRLGERSYQRFSRNFNIIKLQWVKALWGKSVLRIDTRLMAVREFDGNWWINILYFGDYNLGFKFAASKLAVLQSPLQDMQHDGIDKFGRQAESAEDISQTQRYVFVVSASSDFNSVTIERGSSGFRYRTTRGVNQIMLLSSADHFVEIPQVTESLPGSLGNEAIKVERQDECDQGTKGLGSATSIWKHKKITETMKSLSLNTIQQERQSAQDIEVVQHTFHIKESVAREDLTSSFGQQRPSLAESLEKSHQVEEYSKILITQQQKILASMQETVDALEMAKKNRLLSIIKEGGSQLEQKSGVVHNATSVEGGAANASLSVSTNQTFSQVVHSPSDDHLDHLLPETQLQLSSQNNTQ